jgi:Ser/Thr protein kinase RdoA (MazF antagonist)
VLDDATAAAVAAAFGLGVPRDAVADPSPDARGAMGEVTRLDTDRGAWAVKRLFAWARIDNVASDMRLQEAAAGAGLRLPTPVRSTSGDGVATIDGSRYRVYEWVELPALPVAPAAPALAAEIGRALGAIHALRLPASGAVTPWLTTRPPSNRWSELASRAAEAGAAWAADALAALPALRELESIADLGLGGAGGEAVLCHNDVGPGNVGAFDDGSIILLDWEHAGPQDPARELGYVVVGWCVDGGSVAVDAAAALVDGYRSKAALPTPGLEVFSGSACALLNFTAAQGNAALTSDDDDQRAFATGNVTRLLQHPVRRTQLEAILEAVER